MKIQPLLSITGALDQKSGTWGYKLVKSVMCKNCDEINSATLVEVMGFSSSEEATAHSNAILESIYNIEVPDVHLAQPKNDVIND